MYKRATLQGLEQDDLPGTEWCWGTLLPLATALPFSPGLWSQQLSPGWDAPT